MAIEEAVGEEEEICSSPSFKKSQSHTPYANGELFAAATFDRKYCKRNRINRDSTLTRRSSLFENSKSRNADAHIDSGNVNDKPDTQLSIAKDSTQLYDEDDDFNNLLMTNDYDMKSSLSGEILSYFDTKLNKSASLSQPEIDSHPSGTGHVHVPARTQSDVANVRFDFDAYHEREGFCSHLANVNAFNQNDILSSLITESKDNDKSNVNSPNLSICTKSIANDVNVFANSNGNAIVPFLLDSDDGSITSGCETSSIITTAHMDDLMKSEREIDAITLSLARLPLKQTISNLERVTELEHSNPARDNENAAICNEEDSEFSDESGFDENNSSKLSKFHKQSTSAASTVSNADANNNIKHTFNSNTTKTVGRLRINIPKNAKSIDI